MGICGITQIEFVPHELIPGQTKECMTVFTALKLSHSDLNKLYKAFIEIDISARNLVEEKLLYSYLHIEITELNKKMVRLFGDVGQINFVEFVCCLWNFLSTDPKDIIRFTFYFFCDRCEIYMTTARLDLMMETIHGGAYHKNITLKKIITDKIEGLNANRARCYLEDIENICHVNPMVINPVALLHLGLRSKCMGESFWRRQSRIRYQNPEMLKKDFVVNISKSAIESSRSLMERTIGGGPGRKFVAKKSLVAPEQSVPETTAEPTLKRRKSGQRTQSVPENYVALNHKDKIKVKVDETLDIVQMLSDPKAYKHRTAGDGNPVITVTDAVRRHSADVPTIGSHWMAATRQFGSNHCSPRTSSDSRDASPRSRCSSPGSQASRVQGSKPSSAFGSPRSSVNHQTK